MSQIYPLDAVVRKVDKDHKANGVGEKIVVIAPDKRAVVSGGGIIGRWREYIYFLVSNTRSQQAAESATPVIPIRDFANNRTLKVFVSYVASCEQGNEEKAALSLFDGPHPAAVLNEAIGRWLKEKVGQNPADFIDHYFAMKVEVEEYVVERALAETGLSLKALLNLDMREVVENFVVGPFNMPVLTHDYDKEQNLKLRVELHVDRQSQIRAVQHQPYLSTLERLVREQTRKYFSEQVSFHKFATEPARRHQGGPRRAPRRGRAVRRPEGRRALRGGRSPRPPRPSTRGRRTSSTSYRSTPPQSPSRTHSRCRSSTMRST